MDCRNRVVAPILQLKDELFQTFRQRRSIVSVAEYETDKASLERMLADFEKDFARSSSGEMSEAATPQPGGDQNMTEVEDASLPGMRFMMECYEGELKRPIRNLVNGRLLRTILIQVGFFVCRPCMSLASVRGQQQDPVCLIVIAQLIAMWLSKD